MRSNFVREAISLQTRGFRSILTLFTLFLICLYASNQTSDLDLHLMACFLSLSLDGLISLNSLVIHGQNLSETRFKGACFSSTSENIVVHSSTMMLADVGIFQTNFLQTVKKFRFAKVFPLPGTDSFVLFFTPPRNFLTL